MSKDTHTVQASSQMDDNTNGEEDDDEAHPLTLQHFHSNS